MINLNKFDANDSMELLQDVHNAINSILDKYPTSNGTLNTIARTTLEVLSESVVRPNVDFNDEINKFIAFNFESENQ